MLGDAESKWKAAKKNEHPVLEARYAGWTEALRWVLMEV